MKPNIFVHNHFKNEDYFTNSLAYVLNIFPGELGDRLLRRLSILSGHEGNYLGKFLQADFTGFEYQHPRSTSKPDMLIHTTKTKIFFENKLDAPLSKLQLESHFEDVKRVQGRLVFVSNISAKLPDSIMARKNYIRPRGRDHFLWADLMSVFDITTRKGTFANALLGDFKTGLRANGMRAREIFGAKGSLYTNGSDAHKLVLSQYKKMLKQFGWIAWRRPSEYTLRVYPHKNGEPPLFNPRIAPSGEWLNPNFTKECDLIHCWARVDARTARRKIRTLASLENRFPDVFFVPPPPGSGWFMGWIYVPLKFNQRGRLFEIDWDYMGLVWQSIFNIVR